MKKLKRIPGWFFILLLLFTNSCQFIPSLNRAAEPQNIDPISSQLVTPTSEPPSTESLAVEPATRTEDDSEAGEKSENVPVEPAEKAESPTPAPSIPESQELGLPQPVYDLWNAQQVIKIFTAANLKIKETKDLSQADFPGQPFLGKEALWLDLSQYCFDCWGRLFVFESPEALEETHQFLQDFDESGPGQKSWLVVQDNVILQVSPNTREKLVNGFAEALRFLLPESLLVPSNYDISAYESWDEYYPLDRGQNVDPASGMGQRTYNLWEGPNQWLFGQSAWRYQDPDGSTNPPPYYPAAWQGQELDYYYLFQCEEARHPNPLKDCTDWRVYIELGTIINDGTEFHNWGRGGWQSQHNKPTKWEVFYQPDAFGGVCEKNSLRKNYATEYFQDPAIKRPIAVHLPKTIGLRVVSEPYCTVFFNSYELSANSIKEAHLGYVITMALEMNYDEATDQKIYKAINLYYYYLTDVDGERIFKRVSYELYWMRQLKEPLKDGFTAFWWYDWQLPVDKYSDRDVDPTWSDFQWCYQDLSKPPKGLGKLICVAP
jgi:hypothetical protein